MEIGDSCSRLQRSFLSHMGCQGCFLGKRSWRALDAYRRDHGKVDKGNYSLWEYTLEYTEGKFGWLCQLWMVELVVWKIGLRVLVQRGQVHSLLVGETGEGVGSEGEMHPMGLGNPRTGNQCSLVFLL